MATLNIPVFRQWVPFEPVEKSGDDSPLMGRIRGIASSEHVDADGEIIVQKGLEWGYFLNHGFVSLEHPLGVLNAVGESVSAQVVDLNGTPATEITADLHLEDKVGKAVWDKARMLKKSGSRRKLGFSIEGEALERDEENPKLITKARVISVAISAAPKNPMSWFEPIAASMMAMLRKDNSLTDLIGHPAQAEEETGGMATLVPQSIQGVADPATYDKKLLDGVSSRDLLVARVLKQMPQLNWTQGSSLVDELSRRF